MDLQSAISGKAVPSQATGLLQEDHRLIEELFEQHSHELTKQSELRHVIAETICMQLQVHCTVEMDVFLPALKSCVSDHASDVTQVKDQDGEMQEVLAQLKSNPEATEKDRLMQTLGEQFRAHVQAEERLFALFEQQCADSLEALQAEIVKHKEQLTGSASDLDGRS